MHAGLKHQSFGSSGPLLIVTCGSITCVHRLDSSPILGDLDVMMTGESDALMAFEGGVYLFGYILHSGSNDEHAKTQFTMSTEFGFLHRAVER